MLNTWVQRIERMWWRQQCPALPLRMLSPLYARISRYEQGKRMARTIKPDLPLISVGNITVGGSGKTPFVVWLAGELRRKGWQPVILCRGDGGKVSQPQVLHAESLASEVGDEAVLLHRLSDCAVISARDRVAAAAMARDYGDIMILDDGFQYRQLQRDCDVVLIPDAGVGNGCLLPAGPLREPVAALARAGVVVRVGQNTAKPLTSQKEWHWQTQEHALQDWLGQAQAVPEAVYAVTAIARPQRFVDSLKGMGVQVQAQAFFPDHHAFTEKDVQVMLNQGLPVAVTGKDAVKLEALWPEGVPLWVLAQQAEGEAGLFAEVERHLPLPSA